MSADLPLKFPPIPGRFEIVLSVILVIFKEPQRPQPRPASLIRFVKPLPCPCFINTEVLCAAPPEALAHSPSQIPLSCPVAPQSQRELHKDGGGGGGGMARRARAARAPKVKSCATSCGTSSATPCAASFTCSSFMCHLRAGVWGGSRPGRHAQ